jgi:sigma-54 specific flagellar transcriptional regulator A
VGGSKPVTIDVRVVAATHRDLEAEIAAGRFREDLYYRLNVLPLHTCPLRERPEDLPELLGFFAKRFAPRGQAAITFTEDFMHALQAYRWPGNVRELSNLVDRFSTLFTGEHLALGTVPANLLPKGLASLQAERCANPVTSLLATQPPAAQPAAVEEDAQISDVESIIMLAQGGAPVLPAEGLSLKERLADIERDLIQQALERTDGNVSQTARLLSLQRTTLIEKIQKYQLRPGD